MQYIVPQFIDVESKIIGPISVRQFIILLITVGFIFLWFRLFSTVFAGGATLITGMCGGILAFGRVNGQAMHYFILNMVQTLKRPSLKVWHRLPYKIIEQAPLLTHHQTVAPKRLVTRSRLAEMSLLVDTGGAYAGETIIPHNSSQDTEMRTRNQMTINT